MPAKSRSASSVPRETWTDRWGDGFPDAARLDQKQDRENFVRWVTFLAEAQFYQPGPGAHEEIDDCAALVRFAFRNALVAHTAAWRRALGLPFDPGIGDVAKFVYPEWPLGRGLFRVQPGLLQSPDRVGKDFAEFADSATLLRYNSFFISRQVGAARRGDLLFFYQPGQRQPYHAMIFVGPSSFQSRGHQWIVYHTGDLNGHRGEIREVDAALLMRHPDSHWHPAAANPRFLGVYRFDLLR
ncbi:MAG TPA: DUF1175 family protein [Terriglobia bacterium]|nr:DUF1175 family protein [Terriglobia bacterium]